METNVPCAVTAALSGQALRDAAWVLTFPAGAEWHTGAFSANRERQLVKAGVLVRTAREGVYLVGRSE